MTGPASNKATSSLPRRARGACNSARSRRAQRHRPPPRRAQRLPAPPPRRLRQQPRPIRPLPPPTRTRSAPSARPSSRRSNSALRARFDFIETALDSWFAAFSRREPVPTPDQVRGRLSLENALSLERVRRGAAGARDQLLVGRGKRLAIVAEAVGDGIAAVAAKVLFRHLDARRRLPALVFGNVELPVDPRHHFGREAGCDDRGQRLLALDQPLENSVQHLVWRQRILVGLVFAQLRRRRSRDDVDRNDLARRSQRAVRLPLVAQA